MLHMKSLNNYLLVLNTAAVSALIKNVLATIYSIRLSVVFSGSLSSNKDVFYLRIDTES